MDGMTDGHQPGQRQAWLGVLFAILGNICISVALNIQKAAHNQLHNHSPRKETIPSQNDHFVERTTHPVRHKQSSSSTVVIHGRDSHRTSPLLTSPPQQQKQQNSNFPSICPLLHNSCSQNTIILTESDPIPPETLATPLLTKQDSSRHHASRPIAYWKSCTWWIGFFLMTLGELGNFLAYGFASAVLVAPLGTVALVSNAIIAPVFLNEPIRRQDLLGIFFAAIGTFCIVFVSSQTHEPSFLPSDLLGAMAEIKFQVYTLVCIILTFTLSKLSKTSLGKQYLLTYLSLVAIYGAFTVISTKAVSSILTYLSVNAFIEPIFYFFLAILVVTAVLQVSYLNEALARFPAIQVIPTNFVFFTTSTIIGSSMLFNDFSYMAPWTAFISITGIFFMFSGVYLITMFNDKQRMSTIESPLETKIHSWHTSYYDSDHDDEFLEEETNMLLPNTKHFESDKLIPGDHYAAGSSIFARRNSFTQPKSTSFSMPFYPTSRPEHHRDHPHLFQKNVHLSTSMISDSRFDPFFAFEEHQNHFSVDPNMKPSKETTKSDHMSSESIPSRRFPLKPFLFTRSISNQLAKDHPFNEMWLTPLENEEYRARSFQNGYEASLQKLNEDQLSKEEGEEQDELDSLSSLSENRYHSFYVQHHASSMLSRSQPVYSTYKNRLVSTSHPYLSGKNDCFNETNQSMSWTKLVSNDSDSNNPNNDYLIENAVFDRNIGDTPQPASSVQERMGHFLKRKVSDIIDSVGTGQLRKIELAQLMQRYH